MTGIDPVTLLEAFQIGVHTPEVDVTRQVALVPAVADLSLADRFAVASARILGARLHTTDRTLAGVVRRLRLLPVTLY